MTAHSDHSASSPRTRYRHQFRNRTVLCADDEPALRRLYRDALHGAGYQVETYGTGEDAWEAMQDRPFDLLLTDYKMPGMTGLELARRIRREGMRQPIILSSAELMPLLNENLSAVRFAAILIKPFPLSDLLGSVGRALAYATSAQRSETAGASEQRLFRVDENRHRAWGINE